MGYEVKAAATITDGDRTILQGTKGTVAQGEKVAEGISVTWAWGFGAGGAMQGVEAKASPEQLSVEGTAQTMAAAASTEKPEEE